MKDQIMTNARRMISKPLDITLDCDWTNFLAIRKQLDEVEQRFPEYSEFEVRIESEPYDDSGRTYPYIYGKRLESDTEYADRVAADVAAKAAREAAERALFKQLSAKYK